MNVLYFGLVFQVDFPPFCDFPANLFVQSFSRTLRVMDVRAENRGRPQQKVRFSAGPSDGEKLFDPRASGRRGQERPWEIRTKKFMFMLLFLP